MTIAGTIRRELKNVVRKGAVHILAANLVASAAGFVTLFVLAYLISPTDLGRIRILQSFMGVGAIIAGLGMNTAVLKFGSENIAADLKHAIIVVGTRAVLVVSPIVVGLILLLSYFGLLSGDRVVNDALGIYMIAVVPYALADLFGQVLKSEKRMQRFAYLTVTIRITGMVVIVLLVWLHALTGYVAAFILSSVFGVVLLGVSIRSHLAWMFKTALRIDVLRRLLKIGRFAFLANTLGIVLSSTDILMLNFLLADKELIGQYAIAQIAVVAMRLIQMSVNEVVMPYLSERSSDRSAYLSFYKAYQLRSHLVMAALVVIGFVIYPYAVDLVFDGKYHDSIPFFRILVIGLGFWSYYAPKGIGLVALGRVDRNFYSAGSITVVNIALNVILIPAIGAKGAAIATTTAYACGALVMHFLFNRTVRRWDPVGYE